MILVICQPRSGSTTYCERLASEHGYTNKEDYFNPINKYSDEEILAHYDEVVANPNCVVKIFYPIHVSARTEMFESLVEQAEEVHFLYRADFNAQLRSYYATLQLEEQHGHHDSWDNPIDITSEGFTRTNGMTNKTSELLYINLGVFLLRLVMSSADLYKATPDEKTVLVEAESFFTPEEAEHRPVNWDTEPEALPVDVHSLYL